MAENPVSEGAEMNQLRQEAIRRAREMQARAQIPAAYPQQPPPPQPDSTPQPDNAPHPHTEQMPLHPRPENRQPQNRHPEPGPLAGPSLGGALDFLTKDPERTMILLLLLILMEEKSDNTLLFALMYLLS